MTCKSCKGTKRIQLLESFVDCTDCSPIVPSRGSDHFRIPTDSRTRVWLSFEEPLQIDDPVHLVGKCKVARAGSSDLVIGHVDGVYPSGGLVIVSVAPGVDPIGFIRTDDQHPFRYFQPLPDDRVAPLPQSAFRQLLECRNSEPDDWASGASFIHQQRDGSWREQTKTASFTESWRMPLPTLTPEQIVGIVRWYRSLIQR